jgi:hypothetical protein
MEAAVYAGQQELLHRYAAKKAVQDLRNKEDIDDALISCLNAFPLINYCRSELHDEDKALLKEISSSEDKSLSLRQFALSLMRQFKEHTDIRDYLYNLWKSSTEYEIKIEALWSLLIYGNLSEELYDDIRKSFSVAEWDKWLPLIVQKLGGEDKEKVEVKELMGRLFNP